ncbi:hypothetical protein AB4254_13660 [Vibrio breoganii]
MTERFQTKELSPFMLGYIGAVEGKISLFHCPYPAFSFESIEWREGVSEYIKHTFEEESG